MALASTTVRSWAVSPLESCALRAAGSCCALCDDEPEDNRLQSPAESPATARARSLAPVLRVTSEACDRVFTDTLWTY
jgi:hypothetical protein